MKNKFFIGFGAAMVFALGALSKEFISPAFAADQVIQATSAAQIAQSCNFAKSMIFWGNAVICVKK